MLIWTEIQPKMCAICLQKLDSDHKKVKQTSSGSKLLVQRVIEGLKLGLRGRKVTLGPHWFIYGPTDKTRL